MFSYCSVQPQTSDVVRVGNSTARPRFSGRRPRTASVTVLTIPSLPVFAKRMFALVAELIPRVAWSTFFPPLRPHYSTCAKSLSSHVLCSLSRQPLSRFPLTSFFFLQSTIVFCTAYVSAFISLVYVY